MRKELLLIYNIFVLLILIYIPFSMLIDFLKKKHKKSSVFLNSNIFNIIISVLVFMYIFGYESTYPSFDMTSFFLLLFIVPIALYDKYKSSIQTEIPIYNIHFNKIKNILIDVTSKYDLKYEVIEDQFDRVMTIRLRDSNGEIIIKEGNTSIDTHRLFFKRMNNQAYLDNMISDIKKLYEPEQEEKNNGLLDNISNWFLQAIYSLYFLLLIYGYIKLVLTTIKRLF